MRLSRSVTTSYLRVLSLRSDPSPNQPPLVTPRKVVVLPSLFMLVILTRPSITPIQLSTGSPLRQTGTPTGRVRTTVSASTRATWSGASARLQREASRSWERVSMGELSAKRQPVEKSSRYTSPKSEEECRPMPVVDGTPDTFPKLLLRHAQRLADAPAIREKYLGIWQSWTWSQVRDEVSYLAAGLAAAG